jgi:hypothetical protein
MTRLWETDHDYYACEGNYFSNDCHMECESWEEFLEEQGPLPDGLNLVYRWDWYTPDPEDFDEGEDHGPEQLRLFYMGQRKALARSVYVNVTRDDEPAIREWLLGQAKYMADLWAPFLAVK